MHQRPEPVTRIQRGSHLQRQSRNWSAGTLEHTMPCHAMDEPAPLTLTTSALSAAKCCSEIVHRGSVLLLLALGSLDANSTPLAPRVSTMVWRPGASRITCTT